MKDKVDLARGWFSKADSDLAAARLTLAASGPYDTACFHAQQAVEKLMKGFLAYHGEPFPFSHSLDRLAPLCEKVSSALSLSTPEIIGLTDYATSLRYDADFWPTQTVAAEAVAVAEHVRAMILAVLPSECSP